MNAIEYMQQELQTLKEHSNLRRLPQLTHEGRTVIADGRHMLNLSSNDYLGLAADRQLKEEFLQTLTPDTFLPTSSSSRLLTGNFGITKSWRRNSPHFSAQRQHWCSIAAIMPIWGFYPP